MFDAVRARAVVNAFGGSINLRLPYFSDGSLQKKVLNLSMYVLSVTNKLSGLSIVFRCAFRYSLALLIRFRHHHSSHSVPLPSLPTVFPSVSLPPSLISPYYSRSLSLSLSLSLPVFRRRSPLPHISGGRKTPVSAFKISLMATTAAALNA